jgi:hypothetical protein
MRTPRRVDGGALREDEEKVLTRSVPDTTVTTTEPVHISRCVAEFVATLLDLGRRYGDIPTYGSPEWAALDPLDPRRFASVVRAAECWRLDGTGDAIRERIERQLLVADTIAEQIAVSRLRALSWDLSAGEDWTEVERAIGPSRKARTIRAEGYGEPPARQPNPWPPESLDRATWVDGAVA